MNPETSEATTIFTIFAFSPCHWLKESLGDQIIPRQEADQIILRQEAETYITCSEQILNLRDSNLAVDFLHADASNDSASHFGDEKRESILTINFRQIPVEEFGNAPKISEKEEQFDGRRDQNERRE